jgi:hypothetical protein
MQKASAEDQWSVLIGEQKYGPFDLGDLKELAHKGACWKATGYGGPGLPPGLRPET